MADDVALDADTQFEAYEVQSPATSMTMVRRRLVQSLGLSYIARFGDEPETTPLRIQTRIRLRFEQDFGDTCYRDRDRCVRATNESDPGVYLPLATDTWVDAPEAWVHLSGLPMQTTLRVGRHLLTGPLGLSRVDGATVRSSPRPWLSIEVHGGALVRRTSFAGSSAFEPDGVLRLELPIDGSRAPFVSVPAQSWVMGGALSLGREAVLRGTVAVRGVFEGDGVVSSRAGVLLRSKPVPAVSLDARGVLDLVDGEPVDLDAAATVRLTASVRVRAEVARHLPRFDWGAIWNYFDLFARTDAEASVEWTVTERVGLGASAQARVLDGAGETDLGIGGHGRVRVSGWTLTANGKAWGGALGPVANVYLGAARRLGVDWRIEASLSAWHFSDDLRAGVYGTSLWESFLLERRLSDISRVRAEIEHGYNRVNGHRLRAMLSLGIEVWR